MRWFYDASLRKKFFIIFGGIILGALIAIAIGQWAFMRVQVGGRYFSGIELKRDAVDELARIRMNVNMVKGLYYDHLVADEDTEETILKIMDATKGIFTSLLAKSHPSSGDPDRLYCGSCHIPDAYEPIFSSIQSAKDSWDGFEDVLKKRLLAVSSGGADARFVSEATEELSEFYVATMENTKMPIDTLRSVAPLQVEKLKKESDVIRYGYLIAGAITTIVLLLIATFLAKVIVGPVTDVARISASMADGHFEDVEIKVKGMDEIGHMADSFKTMSHRLKDFAGDIREGLFNLSSSAEELSATADTLSQTTGGQRDQTDQVVTSTTEMSQTILDVAQNASRAVEANKDSARLASEGKGVAHEAVVAIERISQVVSDATGAIEALGGRSVEIGEIVSVITDIADQTNLLALNAAIEAARAGDHGRGFAVVADEVRKLAEKTAKSTQEISGRIQIIQSEAQRSVSAMRNSREVVAHGVELVNRVTGALDSITTASSNSLEQVEHIAVAAEEQSSAAEEITQNMHGLSDGIRETTNAIGQMKTVSVELASLAEKLKQQVSWFRTSEDLSPGYPAERAGSMAPRRLGRG